MCLADSNGFSTVWLVLLQRTGRGVCSNMFLTGGQDMRLVFSLLPDAYLSMWHGTYPLPILCHTRVLLRQGWGRHVEMAACGLIYIYLALFWHLFLHWQCENFHLYTIFDIHISYTFYILPTFIMNMLMCRVLFDVVSWPHQRVRRGVCVVKYTQQVGKARVRQLYSAQWPISIAGSGSCRFTTKV